MEKIACKLEQMFKQKLLIYKKLKEILELEKKYIADMDVDSLWKTTERKKQLAAEIEQIRENIFLLLEENIISFDRGTEAFNLSWIISSLPFSLKIKSDLKQIKVELELIKSELAVLASANKRYINEYLSAINGIFATITGAENKQRYTRAGTAFSDKARKFLIRAEV